MKNKKKIKAILLILTLSFALGLTACGSDGGDSGADNGDASKEDVIKVEGTEFSAGYETGGISLTIPKGWTIKDKEEWAKRGYLYVGQDENRRDDGYNQVELTFNVSFVKYTKKSFDEYVDGIEKRRKEQDDKFEGCKEYTFNDNVFIGYESGVASGSSTNYDMRYLKLSSDGRLYEIRVYISDKKEMLTDATEKGIKILLASFATAK